MAEDQPPLTRDSTSEAAEASLTDDLRQLVNDGRTLLEAELAYQKSRAAVAGQGAKGVAGWGALALALLFFTLMALVMGLLLALAPVLGGWGAMAVVVLALLGATALSAWLAARSWQRAARHLSETDQGR
jgi:hypothetical protein